VLLGLMMLYLVAMPSHAGPIWTGPAYHLRWQTRGQSPLTDIVLLYLAAKLVLKLSPPMLVDTLVLSGKGAESLDRHRLVLSL
jgi:hypothetical protein